MPVIMLIDMGLYGLKRVVNSCCGCCRELMVRDLIRVNDSFIRQTLDPIGYNCLSELSRVESTLWVFFLMFCPLGLLTGSSFTSPSFYVIFFFFF